MIGNPVNYFIESSGCSKVSNAAKNGRFRLMTGIHAIPHSA
jgi:hypothetical protein